MKSCYSEIRELEKELEKLQKKRRVLRAKRDILVIDKQMDMCTEQTELELEKILYTINAVHKDIHKVYARLYYLRKKRMKEAREFYNPMDEVDIIMLIHKDRCIHGITL